MFKMGLCFFWRLEVRIISLRLPAVPRIRARITLPPTSPSGTPTLLPPFSQDPCHHMKLAG